MVNGDFSGIGDEGRDEEGMEGLDGGGCDDIKQESTCSRSCDELI